MTPDTDSMPLDGPARRRKVVFDPSINLGHILTFIGFLVTGSVAYFDLRERISLQEIRTQAVALELDGEKARVRETLRDMRDDMREVRRGIDSLLRGGEKRLGDK